MKCTVQDFINYSGITSFFKPKYYKMKHFFPILFIWLFFATSCETDSNYPDPYNNPQSPLMLTGDWLEHPHKINFDKLPRVPREHIVISNVTEQDGVNQHNYLVNYDGRTWSRPVQTNFPDARSKFHGLLMSAGRNRATEDYFAGNRSFAGWVICLSMLGTIVSSATYFALPAPASI